MCVVYNRIVASSSRSSIPAVFILFVFLALITPLPARAETEEATNFFIDKASSEVLGKVFAPKLKLGVGLLTSSPSAGGIVETIMSNPVVDFVVGRVIGGPLKTAFEFFTFSKDAGAGSDTIKIPDSAQRMFPNSGPAPASNIMPVAAPARVAPVAADSVPTGGSPIKPIRGIISAEDNTQPVEGFVRVATQEDSGYGTSPAVPNGSPVSWWLTQASGFSPGDDNYYGSGLTNVSDSGIIPPVNNTGEYTADAGQQGYFPFFNTAGVSPTYYSYPNASTDEQGAPIISANLNPGQNIDFGPDSNGGSSGSFQTAFYQPVDQPADSPNWGSVYFGYWDLTGSVFNAFLFGR